MVWRPSTRATRLITIRMFAAWMVDNDVIRRDFTRGAPKIRRPRQEPRDIQIEHFIVTLAACQTTREQVVVWLMYGLGMRCIEISRATIDDWDTAVQEIHVVGKALHERTLPVPTAMRGSARQLSAGAGRAVGSVHSQRAAAR
jgi:site-specific recombinase XerC